MKRILCWLFGHHWYVCGGDGIFFQQGMDVFNYKYCTRCLKTIKFDIHKAETPLPPISSNQKYDWVSWYADHSEGEER